RLRPFASGRIGILRGLIGAGASVLAGLLLASVVSLKFLSMLILYLSLTTAYSWYLKQFVLIDVITLSMLYTFRILAGAVAIEVETSAWLLAFSSFAFLSLALVKRCSELITMQNRGGRTVDGRDYRTDDVRVLQPLGIGAAISAIVIF